MVPGIWQKPNKSLVLLHLILFKNTQDHIRHAEADTFIFLLNSIPLSCSKGELMFKKILIGTINFIYALMYPKVCIRHYFYFPYRC